MHLTPFFNRKKFECLANIIRGADQTVIVGDLWDGHLCTFEEFVRSPWNKLFPLLKERETIYLYGNHDPEEWCDERVSLFSNRQASEIDLRVGRFDLHLEHGHRITPELSTLSPDQFRLLHRYFPPIGWADFLLFQVILHGLGGERWARFNNRNRIPRFKRRSKELAETGKWLVCGHLHLAELDHEAKYANCGFVGLGRAHYLRIDQDINLVKVQY
ncbi:hypothetical protein A2V54_00675 [candidate division WWE3 bacterium RBG_19FT_COMBO_53_11]|uniref:Calcineurin-like phosphoesterase domain-containing protein n=1 Tax=candidate division WWE3 bacterium RBG_19FT_COMBO_53_11 TaxID=1802613 RepID=A0A1F4UIB8_UNCKA|nr:MAG: hypothetical protein A2155_01990 [candidate division WWE3 bacterium RBG_16_52_45]OGC44657.1 MAG: hypothetical protein A2V54_00675 [candidate division WWE3 bacterium RBG_19FT_COMBO_53_11]